MNILKSIFGDSKPKKAPIALVEDRSMHIKLPNGSIYTGKILHGKLEGIGTLVYENGERYQGMFHLGMKHGKGKYYYIRGELYIGDWFQNKKHGIGQYFYEQSRQRYQGQFLNNMKHGQGSLYEDDGSEYKGTFANNKKHGEGEYFDANLNKRFHQLFQNGKLVKEGQVIQEQKYNTLDLDQKPNDQGLKQDLEVHSMEDFNLKQRLSSTSQGQICKRRVFDSLMTFSPTALKDQQKQSEEKKKMQSQLNTMVFNSNKHVYIWTDDDVCNWLESIGFLDYIDAFYRERVDGLALLLINEDDLKELGVVVGDRRDMIKEIDFLRVLFRVQSTNDYQALKLKDFKGFNEIKASMKQIGDSDSDSSDSGDGFPTNTKLIKQESGKSSGSNIEKRVQQYLKKHGIKLKLLIPKEQIEIIKQIGKGGFGQVYLGRWLGNEVAVKRYVKKEGLRNRHIGHFIEQVQLISMLSHPSVVLYMGICIYDNQYEMITEFLSNGSLFDYLHQNSSQKDLTDDRVFYIVKDIALGMTYLHGKKILHCDLKSSNVLIDSSWNVKLCDFGLSRIHSPKGADVRRAGTPHWMAPQILRGEKYCFQSDVYSFGMVVWQLLAQEIPYKNYSSAQIIGMVGKDQKHQIQTPTKTDNPLMIQLMKMCTRRDLKERPSFSQVVEYLQQHEHLYLDVLQRF